MRIVVTEVLMSNLVCFCKNLVLSFLFKTTVISRNVSISSNLYTNLQEMMLVLVLPEILLAIYHIV